MLSREVGSGAREGPRRCQPRRSEYQRGCARYTWSWGEHSAGARRRGVVSHLVGLPWGCPASVSLFGLVLGAQRWRDAPWPITRDRETERERETTIAIVIACQQTVTLELG